MKEYIEKAAVLNSCGWYNTVNGKSICAVRKDEIASIPAADVVERKRGKWDLIGQTFRDGGYRDEYGCSECDYEVSMHIYIGNHLMNFCPNCGAKMDGDIE